MALKTMFPGSSHYKRDDLKACSEVITITEKSSAKKSCRKQNEWVHDPSIRLSPSRQVDMSQLDRSRFKRVDWKSHQVWDSKWSSNDESVQIFRNLFREGTDSKFSLEFLKSTGEMMSNYFNHSDKNKNHDRFLN